MRALVLRDFYDIAVEERPDPVAGPGQAVVEVIATGICGSDFHGYSGENGRRHPGQIMGHETVGRIRELGTDAAELTVGQLVTVNPVMSCGVRLAVPVAPGPPPRRRTGSWPGRPVPAPTGRG